MTGRKRHGWLPALAVTLCLGTAPACAFDNFPPGGMRGGPPGMMPPNGGGSFPSGGMGGPPGGMSPPGAGGNSSAEVGSLVPPVGLRLVREADVTPAGANGARPGLVAAGGKLFVAYLDLRMPHSNQLVQLDADLKPVRVFAVAQGEGAPTDMRWVADPDGTLWCGYELMKSTPHTAGLSLASYRVTADGVIAGVVVSDTVRGSLLSPPFDIPSSGAEITNDPGLFPFDGRVFLGTRRFERAVLPFQTFRPDGQREASFELDLSGMFPGRGLSVYSLVAIKGRPWLLAGAETSPQSPSPAADIYAVPLQRDLRRPDGQAVPLLATPEFETYVSGARSSAGRLALVYNIMKFSAGFEGYLQVFDTTQGFTSIGNAQITKIPAGLPIDAHLSVELLGDRIFVAYYTPREHLMVREYALEAR